MVLFCILALQLFGNEAEARQSSQRLHLNFDRTYEFNSPQGDIKRDFDGDGILDNLSWSRIGQRRWQTGHVQMTIDFSSRGKEVIFESQEPLLSFAVSVVSLNEDLSFPSIIVSRLAHPWRPSGNRPQIFFLNVRGKLKQKHVGINTFSQRVDCTKFVTKNSGALCVYSGYRGTTKVVEILKSGQVIDRTQLLALPIPRNISHKFQNGYFGFGVKWVDFDLNNKLDLVLSAQHSDTLIAKNLDENTFSFDSISYNDPTGEYKDVYAPRKNDRPLSFPCVFFSMEMEESRFGDFLKCYSSKEGSWYVVTIPKHKVPTNDRSILFKDIDGDGAIELLIEQLNSKQFHVYSFKTHTVEISKNSFVVAHSQKCMMSKKIEPGNEQRLIQGNCSKHQEKSWSLQYFSNNDVFTIKNQKNGLCLDTEPEQANEDEPSFFKLNPVSLATCNQSTTQKWSIKPIKGHWQIRSLKSGLCLGVYRENPITGAQISEVPCGNFGNKHLGGSHGYSNSQLWSYGEF